MTVGRGELLVGYNIGVGFTIGAVISFWKPIFGVLVGFALIGITYAFDRQRRLENNG